MPQVHQLQNISPPLRRQFSESCNQMKFVGFTARSDESGRSCEQFFHGNTKAMSQGPQPVSCRLPCRVVLDSVDITWSYALSKAGALLGHINQRETLLIPDSANEVPEGFWTPVSHSNGLPISVRLPENDEFFPATNHVS